MAAKTPRKFRQARKAAKVDAKKTFSGAKKAGLKDKSPFVKFSADDKKALSEMAEEARNKYITDDKGNKIKTTNITTKEAAAEYKSARKASNEAFRSAMRAEFGEYAGKKATQSDYDSNPKFKDRAPKTASSKPADKTPSANQKVRSAVTAPEPKPQGYKVDKRGKRIKPKGFKTVKTAEDVKKAAATESKKMAKLEKKTIPVAKKGFAAGKELNAEGRAIYDKLIKEGVKPKSALNKALFRQEKAAKVVNKASSSNVPAKDSGLRKSLGISTNKWSKMTQAEKQAAVKKSVASKVPAGARPKGYVLIQGKKYDVASGAADRKMEKLARQQTPVKIPSTVVSSKPNVPGKELVVRPKPGAVVAKTAAKKGGAKAAALGAAKSAGKLLTGRAALAITAAGLVGKPVLQALTKEPAGAKKAKINAAKTPGPEARSNQPRITGQGRFVGTKVGAGGSTYRVNAGDTLSGIAKKSGVTLSELMAANKKIKDPRKIYRNTAINIPSKGKVPAGGYAGPVPYRPKKK